MIKLYDYVKVKHQPHICQVREVIEDKFLLTEVYSTDGLPKLKTRGNIPYSYDETQLTLLTVEELERLIKINDDKLERLEHGNRALNQILVFIR